MEKDIIIMKTADGQDEEVELVLTVNHNKKKYILYRNKENEIYASYMLDNDDTLYNDLTDEEYVMLESVYKKGSDMYDK